MTVRKTLVSISIAIVILYSIASIVLGKTYKFGEEDFKLIPYHGKEILYFVSNSNDTFVIKLLKYTRNLIEKGSGINKITLEHYNLVYQHGVGGSEREDYLCLLTAGKNGQPTLGIYLDGVKGKKFRGAIKLESLNEAEYSPILIDGKVVKDVLVIGIDEKEALASEPEKLISKVYWSKSRGLVRFDYSDNIYYELKGNGR